MKYCFRALEMLAILKKEMWPGIYFSTGEMLMNKNNVICDLDKR